MNKLPTISVIIPTYNSTGYIEETLNSLANQTLADFEVIIVDDQSTDNTVEVAANIHKKFGLNGNVIVRPEDIPKGVANCRNLGIKYATGDWISFLDSDDLFMPDKISDTIKLIAAYGDTCYAYFHCSRQFEDGTNKTLGISSKKSYTEPKDIFEELTHKNFITTSSVTIKKSLVNSIGGFDSSLHGIEDYMLWLRVAKRTKWYYNSDVWTDYRVRKSSLMGGREMTYYVGQNAGLIKAAKKTNEFSVQDISAIEHYLFYDVMSYYSMVSIDTRGWGDFIKGLKALRRIGKTKLAITLFNKHFNFLILKKLSFFKNLKTS